MKAYRTLLSYSAAVALSSTAIYAESENSITDAQRHFTLKVKPVFLEKCNGCHGDEKKVRGDFNMLTRESLLAGGEFFGKEALTPGHPEKSAIMATVRWEDPDFEMPPKENDRLSEAQINDLAQWIKDGAVWPSEETQALIQEEEKHKTVTEDGILVKTSGGENDSWTYRRYKIEDIWAFQPLKDASLSPDAGHPVDHFIDKKLAEHEINPAPQADPKTLYRRLHYDLLGLPPSQEKIDTFLSAWQKDSQKAWSDSIDELLASDQYGEHWGQHWLDVVRYGDSAGFSNDWESGNAWRYRDYVIRSFNQDKPWNRFIMEQLAGDELGEENPELQIATGFLRMGPWELTGMTVPIEQRQAYLDDLTNITGQAFMSTTMRCAKCHDHKFDPIPTKDYYRLYAAFGTTQPAEIKTPFLEVENLSLIEQDKAKIQAQIDFSKSELDRLYAIREEAAKSWYKQRNLEYKDFKTRKPLKEDKPARNIGLTDVEHSQLKTRENEGRLYTRMMEQFMPLTHSVYNGGVTHQASGKLRKPNPKDTKMMKKHETMPESFILGGGSVHAPGLAVKPGVLSALGLPTDVASEENPYRLEEGFDKRRLTLASWISNEENSLATRSIVNRVWGYHFGRGIAANPNNFGATGAKPTHPELLDYLAKTFVQEGWSIKKLHKKILTSQAWMRSTEHPKREKLDLKDPSNQLLSVFEPRRLTAEELRDTMLSHTGELNLDMGGLPTRPEINREVAFGPRMVQFALAPVYQASPTPEQRNRRSVYSKQLRGLRDPFMEVFNKPLADTSCELRDSPSVTPQVFTLINSETMTARALGLALRVQKEASSVKEQISKTFSITFTREPSKKELNILLKHYKKLVEFQKDKTPERTSYPTKLTRSLVEEFTGESFEYDEYMPFFEDYVYDPQPADVSAETRALADISMVLFNTNEYIFVY